MTATPATNQAANGAHEARTRYALCGLSARAVSMYALPLLGKAEDGGYSDYGELVAILDLDQERIAAFNASQGLAIPAYRPDEFDRLVAETRPDVVIAAGPDFTHADHMIAALAHDLDVITEKPMVIDMAQASAVIAAERRSQGTVRVAHNSRYTAAHRQIKRLMQSGALGRITNVEFVWNIDTYHGSSYFERWNRDRAKSGGLTITKGCHHFDLINWWLDAVPEQVFAYGALNYYGANSPFNPSHRDGKEYSAVEQQERCPYWLRWRTSRQRRPRRGAGLALPNNAQYSAANPLYIYDKEIAIEDTYSAVVRYQGGATMTYSTNFSAPWEGYILGINGTGGRLESVSYTNPARCPFPTDGRQTITYYPLFGERQVHETRHIEGGHGGADPMLRDELFIGPDAETAELGLAAGSREGAYAVAIGEAVWRSVAENRPVAIADLLPAEALTTAR
jgi:predicted dehydrogenase